jgi:hypothetical protein
MSQYILRFETDDAYELTVSEDGTHALNVYTALADAERAAKQYRHGDHRL